ncbi:MAG: ATP-binding cassette domain-containing protein [Erysipelotrichaceae bacterium]|nr:ATP-binding cassette domain-containing protein [Erysipelotrichaceae bacterium]
MIDVQHLSKNFGDLEVIKDVSFHIDQGDIFGIIGQSGAGKSTLLRCFNGLEPYQQGNVTVDGHDIGNLSKNELNEVRKEMGITIVVVTHQMEVIKQICNKVAFLKDGKILSVGKPEELLVAPNIEIQKFVGDDIEFLPKEGTNIKLFFTDTNSSSHTITELARTLDIDFDICQGKLETFRAGIMGSLIINVKEADKERVFNYLTEKEVLWEEI